MSNASVKANAISATDLTIKAGERVLLDHSSFEVADGELCLLLGVSGTGKSITLALLAGLLTKGDGIHVSGQAQVLGHPVQQSAHPMGVPGIGIVFQDFALLDDVNAEANVLFGIDHSGIPTSDRKKKAREYLDEFGLPGNLSPSRMSGGMKQRLALARALAFSPKLMLYDEPTSGLDPAMADRVAERIREVHQRHGMTTLIVTHDLPPFLERADRVILLDPETRSYRSVAPREAQAALARLQVPKLADDVLPKRSVPLWRWPLAWLENVGDFGTATFRTLGSLVPRFPSTGWGLHFLWRYLRLTTLGSGLPFLALAGAIAGFIVTFFLFGIIPFRGYTEPVLQEEFIGSLGYALYRVVVPGVVTLLFASRSGAALATDLGNRALTKQLDAMRGHGVPPQRYLLTGMTLACVLGMPFLFVCAYAMSHITSLLVFLGTHENQGAWAFNAHFHELLGTEMFGLPGGTGYVLQKILLCALATAGVAYHTAANSRHSGAQVANAVTTTIIRATILVLLVHLVYAFFEF